MENVPKVLSLLPITFDSQNQVLANSMVALNKMVTGPRINLAEVGVDNTL